MATLLSLPMDHTQIEAAIAEFAQGKPAGPVPRSVWLGDGFVELFAFNGAIHLAAVFVDVTLRHKGLGSQYLRELLAIADKHQVKVECSVKPFGIHDPLTKMGVSQLKAWYKRHDFKPVPKRAGTMLRLPRPTPASIHGEG